MAKKKKNKNNNKKTFKKLLTTIFIIALIIGVAFFGIKGLNEVNQVMEEIDNFEVKIPEELGNKIDLPTSINENITIKWQSTNEQYVSSSGEIVYPDFESDDQTIKLIGKIEVVYKEILSETVASILGKEIQDIELTINLKAKEATDDLKVKSVVEKLELISETYSSINLPTKLCYESINITWSSSNENVLSNKGKVTTPLTDTLVTLKAIVSSNSYNETKEFKITVLSKEPIIEVINDQFDNQAATSRYDTINSTGGVTYYNARILESEGYEADDSDLNATIPSYLRLRNDEKNGYFEINNIINPESFSFKYKLSSKILL